MNEQLWLTGADPAPMLRFLRGRACNRKLRLFAASAYRLIWRWVVDANSRAALEVARARGRAVSAGAEEGDDVAGFRTRQLNAFGKQVEGRGLAAGHRHRLFGRCPEARRKRDREPASPAFPRAAGH